MAASAPKTPIAHYCLVAATVTFDQLHHAQVAKADQLVFVEAATVDQLVFVEAATADQLVFATVDHLVFVEAATADQLVFATVDQLVFVEAATADQLVFATVNQLVFVEAATADQLVFVEAATVDHSQHRYQAIRPSALPTHQRAIDSAHRDRAPLHSLFGLACLGEGDAFPASGEPAELLHRRIGE